MLTIDCGNRSSLCHCFRSPHGDSDGFTEAAKRLDRAVEAFKRSDDMPSPEVLPKRRVVERTFAWLGRYRCLSKDHKSRPPAASR